MIECFIKNVLDNRYYKVKVLIDFRGGSKADVDPVPLKDKPVGMMFGGYAEINLAENTLIFIKDPTI